MPSSYAHYRFGTQTIALMPADVRGPILRHRALFDMGLHGPDFLLFHHFLKKTPLVKLGTVYHEKSGRDFFTQSCAILRRNQDEAHFAYLYGLLTHYCLDSVCHPFVYQMTDDTDLGHAELETEFDRFLLALDGCKKPHEYRMSRHMQLNKEEYAVVAAFFPDISQKDVTTSIHNMSMAQQLVTLPTPVGHSAVAAIAKLAGKTPAGKVMTIGPNPTCDHLNAKLMALYEKALNSFPEYLEQLNHHMAYGEPFGQIFAVNFNRG